MEGVDKFLVDETFLESEHGRFGCITCHGGQDTMDMEAAHVGLTARPSSDLEDGACVDCHEDITDKYEDAVHYTTQNLYEGLEEFSHPGALEDEDEPLRQAYDEDCSKCHATCGSCHVSRPETYEGGLHSEHEFTREPPMEDTCFGCHGERAAGEFLGETGTTEDVHYEEMGYDCYDCHDVTNFHGAEEGKEVESPQCQDCHDDVYSDDSPVEAHQVHEEDQLACQVCHSSAAQSCFDCHITLDEEGEMASNAEPRSIFAIGQNPEPTEELPYEYISLRHVPTAADTFAELGGELPNFNEISNWKYAPIHNIQRVTRQNQSCNSCHGNENIFLSEDDIPETSSKASYELIPDEIPEEVDPERDVVVEEEIDEEEEILRTAAVDYFDRVNEDNNMTSSSEIHESLQSDPDSIFILDIRDAEDFEDAHIDGAYHSEATEVADIMENIPQNKDVFVACYSGQNAGYITAALRLAGFDNVTTLQSGINNGWKEEGYELDGSGMNAAADLQQVSEPSDGDEEIIWEQAKEVISEGPNWITTDEHEEMLESLESDPESYHVVDIRAEADYNEGHIKSAEHVEWGDFSTIIDELPTTVPVVVACYSGQTGAQTTGVLNMITFDNAYNLLSGVRDGWVGTNELPLVEAE